MIYGGVSYRFCLDCPYYSVFVVRRNWWLSFLVYSMPFAFIAVTSWFAPNTTFQTKHLGCTHACSAQVAFEDPTDQHFVRRPRELLAASCEKHADSLGGCRMGSEISSRAENPNSCAWTLFIMVAWSSTRDTVSS